MFSKVLFRPAKKACDGTIFDGQARRDIPIQELTDASSTTDLSAAPKGRPSFLLIFTATSRIGEQPLRSQLPLSLAET